MVLSTFFGRCANPWRDDAVGRLDVGLAVDAKLCDEDAQECLGLLGLAAVNYSTKTSPPSSTASS
jgi:hypothetical protein